VTTSASHDQLWINGTMTTPSSDAVIELVNPATAEPFGTVPRGGPADIDAAVAAARSALGAATWAATTPQERATLMERLADELDARGARAADAATRQIGMPTSIAHASEAIVPAILLRYYADLARKMEDEERRPSLSGGQTLIRRTPVGVVAVIVPWNFPQTLTFFKLAPILAAGCTAVIKPAPETVLDTYILAEAAEAAGIPAGVINVVPGDRDLGAYMVSHPGIGKVSFTGSKVAGQAIGEVCGRMLRPVTLELGGKSAAIVLDDVDLPRHLENFFAATLMNSGQSCYLSTRILAPRSRYDEIVDTVTDFVSSIPFGDPTDAATLIGPVISQRQRDRIEGFIERGIADGGRVTTGGKRANGLGPGYFIEPTVFADVDNQSTIGSQEIFGPVLSIISYDDVDDAVRIANDSEYGLGGTVWTEDPDVGLEVARRVETGTIGINNYNLDFASPFGGVKHSGLGSELGPEALGTFQSVKSIYLA
jgi:aldehyde dehydrogenase (NAD+)